MIVIVIIIIIIITGTVKCPYCRWEKEFQLRAPAVFSRTLGIAEFGYYNNASSVCRHLYNEYQSKGGDALQLESKGRDGSYLLVAGKTE